MIQVVLVLEFNSTKREMIHIDKNGFGFDENYFHFWRFFAIFFKYFEQLRSIFFLNLCITFQE